MIRSRLVRTFACLALVAMWAGSVCAQTPAWIADNLIAGNDASTNGTALCSMASVCTVLDNLTEGTPQGVWSGVGTLANMTVEASGGSGTNFPVQVYLRDAGTAFTTSTAHRALRYNATVANSYVSLGTTGGKFFAVEWLGWIKQNITQPIPGNGKVFDMVRVDNVGGDFAISQLWSEDAPNGGGMAINLHYVDTGGSATTTGHFVIATGTTIAVALNFDSWTHTAEEDIYDSSKVLQATFTANTHATATTWNTTVLNQTISTMRMGNAEAGIGTGNIDFESVVIDWTKADLLPIAGYTNYWVTRSGNSGGANPPGTGAATTITVNVAGVSAGDTCFIGSKWETSFGSAQKICTDGATCAGGNVATLATGVAIQNNGNQAPFTMLGYFTSMTATGTVTFTANIGASVSFRDMAAICFTKPSNTGTVAIDGTAQTNTGTTAACTIGVGPCTITTPNTTTTGSNGIACQFYGEFGATVGPQFINTSANAIKVRPDALQLTTVGNSQLSCVQYITGFTGGVTDTMSASNRWNLELVSLAAASNGRRMSLLRVGP